eukprot:Tbor_TRINITY_DN5915_c0_g2::TRINITY_DN5915_c0_g2_i1::g.18883::m.18883/K19179/GDE1; glycerophosphoinositol glycerophosphodiesterase
MFIFTLYVILTIILTIVTLLVSCYYYFRLPPGPCVKHWCPSIFGHRGCRNIKGIPENTIEAFAYAERNGAYGIECDVRLTKDGEVVCFHDNYVGHECTGFPPETRLDTLTLAEVRQLQYTTTDKRDESFRVPTLEEIIIFCKEKKLKILIELKELQRPKLCVNKVMELYDKYNEYMIVNTMLISFSPVPLYQARAINPKVAVIMLHCSDTVSHIVSERLDYFPYIFQCWPSMWDRVLSFCATEIAPLVIGLSAIGPRFCQYNDGYKKKWIDGHDICIYLWGFTGETDCTPKMVCDGVFLSCDDNYDYFYAIRQSS